MSCWAVVVAAGRGARFGLQTNKAYAPLRGRTPLSRCLDGIAAADCFDGCVVVTDVADFEALAAAEGAFPLVKAVVAGGDTRQASVLQGLRALPDDTEIVAIHDAARFCASPALFRETILSAMRFGSGVAADAVTDTIKEANAHGDATRTLDRDALRAVQTPQTFRYRDILAAHERAAAEGFAATDDAALMERYHGSVRLVVLPDSRANRKLTMQADVPLMLGAPTLRIGHGFDAHRLVPGRALVLCGVAIPYALGLLGHSDADVALHALIDAMLGAAALGDIGALFPDAGAAYKGIASTRLLDKTVAHLAVRGFRVTNADLTIVAQAPKLAPHVAAMRQSVADALGLPISSVGVKATTTEKMGYEGRGEGISATAVVLITNE